eukprot:2196333-Amphidinium_carterae.1
MEKAFRWVWFLVLLMAMIHVLAQDAIQVMEYDLNGDLMTVRFYASAKLRWGAGLVLDAVAPVKAHDGKVHDTTELMTSLLTVLDVPSDDWLARPLMSHSGLNAMTAQLNGFTWRFPRRSA